MTTAATASARGKRKRCKRVTAGLSKKARRIASAIGMSTGLSQDNSHRTIPLLARIMNPRVKFSPTGMAQGSWRVRATGPSGLLSGGDRRALSQTSARKRLSDQLDFPFYLW
jgi:hypothetical protein